MPADQTSCSVPDLIEGETYEFRVRAVNTAGPGLPSDATEQVTVKARNAGPKIDRTNLVPVRIKAGQSFNFDVNISGEPVPKKKWLLKKKEIKSGGTTTIKMQDYNTKIRVTGASRAESGTYTIVAENENGKDSADVEVIVLGKCYAKIAFKNLIYDEFSFFDFRDHLLIHLKMVIHLFYGYLTISQSL